MKQIISYIREYIATADGWLILLVMFFTAILVFINYHFHLNDRIGNLSNFLQRFTARYILSLSAFALPYLFASLILKKDFFQYPLFIFFLLLAPAVFALKMEAGFSFSFSENAVENRYWNRVVYWPVLLLITGAILFITWKRYDAQQPFYGLYTSGFSWQPYLLMLLIMLPLIVLAATQHDFLQTYPKLKIVGGSNGIMTLPWWKKLLFELSYGSDFFTIELFFRGFLILAFVKWGGPNVILPMACFYCTIHFGKPLAECISSFFGGLLLGIVVYKTQSIYGGLVVHLGIAWMMELAGYLAHYLKK